MDLVALRSLPDAGEKKAVMVSERTPEHLSSEIQDEEDEAIDFSTLSPPRNKGLKFMTAEQYDLYDRQVAESEGFEVDDFGHVTEFIIRPLPVDDELRGNEFYVTLIDKVVAFHNATGGNVKKICNPYILKLMIDVCQGPTLYFTFTAHEVDDGNATGDFARDQYLNVYQSKVWLRFPLDRSVVYFCRRKGDGKEVQGALAQLTGQRTGGKHTGGRDNTTARAVGAASE